MRNPLTAAGSPVGTAAAIAVWLAFAVLISSMPARSAAVPPNLVAQTPARTDSSLAIVKGVIVDSLRGGYLSDAIVAISGTTRMGVTDSLGGFRIDGVQPGTRRIEVYHARLDELGIALVTPLMPMGAGDSVSLTLAFPSAPTITAKLCGASAGPDGPSAVFGQVLSADDETPIGGARLLLEWIEYRIVRKRLKTSFEQRSTVSLSDGHFKLCGLPGELAGNLSASFGGDTTAKVEIRVNPVLATRTLHLSPADNASTTAAAPVPPSPAPSATRVRELHTGTVTGRIVDSRGAAVSRARVAIDRLDTVVLSGDDGRFVLHGVRPGTRALNVRRLGFEPKEVAVDVRTKSPTDFTVRLADFVPTLDTVIVTAMRRDAGLDRAGFSRRKKAGMGTFIGPDQLQQRHALSFVDLFSSVPMLRRGYDDEGRTILVGRPRGLGRSCIDYFVDDVRWLGDGIEEFILPAEVGAIEVYAGGFTPAQFVHGVSGCGTTVVIWTKPKLGIR